VTKRSRVLATGLAVAFGFVGFDVVFGGEPATVDAFVRAGKLFLVAVVAGLIADRREQLSTRF